MARIIALYFSLLSALIVTAQVPATKPSFIQPMDLPIEVAGNFMELRTNHFHSGLDMKTNGRIGQPVMAVADGWVSRIKISPWGYGKAVYIDHPSGYTTVYGHLSRLDGAIAKACLEAQYRSHDFSIDQYFKKGEIPVKQGETIAYSGNTGGSSAPHLHFEVRRTSDQHALDPQAYGMLPLDNIPPDISGIRIDALDSSSASSPYAHGAVGIAVVPANDSTYILKPGPGPAAFGTVGLSVNVTDTYDHSDNTCGIRDLTVSVDGRPVFSARLDEVDFGTQRFANAYMDYGLFQDKNMHYNRCYRLPNNKLAVYGPEAAQGRITVEPGKDHTILIEAKDAAGNRSTLTFMLHGATEAEAATWPKPQEDGQLFRWSAANVLSKDGLRFTLPPNALYQDTRIQYRSSPAPAKAYAALHVVQNEETPLQLAGTLTIDVTKAVPQGRTGKLLVVRMHRGKPIAQGGTYANGAVTAQVKTLGAFTVMLDTTPPVLTPLNLHADMKGRSGFRIKVGDNLSGLEQWKATLDGHWILLEYDPKRGELEHTFDSFSDLPGTHELKVEAIDERGNRSSLTRRFNR